VNRCETSRAEGIQALLEPGGKFPGGSGEASDFIAFVSSANLLCDLCPKFACQARFASKNL